MHLLHLLTWQWSSATSKEVIIMQTIFCSSWSRWILSYLNGLAFCKWQNPHVSTCWIAPEGGRQTDSVAADAGTASVPFCMEHNSRYVVLGSIRTCPPHPLLKRRWCLEESNKFQTIAINFDLGSWKCWVCFINARRCSWGNRKCSSIFYQEFLSFLHLGEDIICRQRIYVRR